MIRFSPSSARSLRRPAFGAGQLPAGLARRTILLDTKYGRVIINCATISRPSMPSASSR